MSLSMMNLNRMLAKIENEGYELNDFYVFYLDELNTIQHDDTAEFFMNQGEYDRAIGFGLKKYYKCL